MRIQAGKTHGLSNNRFDKVVRLQHQTDVFEGENPRKGRNTREHKTGPVDSLDISEPWISTAVDVTITSSLSEFQ
jgi:hypothetical protein